MRMYCPQCGTEYTSGRKCPSCDHIDESCSACGTHLGEGIWTCLSCDTPREYCPRCGDPLDEESCPSCGTKRPYECTECGEEMPVGASECPGCGYAPGVEAKQSSKKLQLAGILVPLGAIYGSTLFLDGVAMYAAILLLGGLAAIVGLVVFVVGSWKKRSSGDEGPGRYVRSRDDSSA